MKRTTLPSALRELQATLMQPAVIAVLLGIGVILAFAGAFDTDTHLRTVPRIAYWMTLVVLTYSGGNLVNSLLLPLVHKRPFAVRVGAMAVGTTIVVVMIVALINTAVFGPVINTFDEWVQFVTSAFGITLIVSIVLDLIFYQKTAATMGEAAPALLDRLPLAKRSALVALSVEDHYVRVRTTAGEEMILMRLSDAIRETAPTQGLQVHRSHWVALDAVTDARRDGARAHLTMSHGDDIPVSRANIAAIKDAGLLV